MSYIALYRKYRPKHFEDVIGQDHIVRTLTNQVVSNRISHAYLFCGTRGTGKTSVAKICAQLVNCEHSEKGYSCGECESCVEIEAERSMNIIEIDAASNNGVDNIREIREEVRYAPTLGKYKVYVIDEVHMLSAGAFNALLKTLEEPPSHVIFILATTDPQKIPVTILSRCQRFDFRRITSDDIASKLNEFADLESVDLAPEAAQHIAYLADGAMRDALSILDQCISFYFDETITVDKVLQLLGAVDKGVFFELTDAIRNKDSAKAMQICEQINTDGRDIGQFVLDSIVHFRNVLVAQSTENPASILDYSSDFIDDLKTQAANVSGTNLMRYISVFSELDVSMKGSSNPRILLEVALLRLCEPSADESQYAVLDRLETLEKDFEKSSKEVVYIEKEASSNKENKATKPKPVPKAVPEDIKKLTKLWPKIKSGFNEMYKNLLVDVQAGYLEDDIFYLIYSNNGMLKVSQSNHYDLIKKAVDEEAKKDVNIRQVSVEEYEALYKEIYGPDPDESKETEDINKTIDMIKRKIQFPIQVE